MHFASSRSSTQNLTLTPFVCLVLTLVGGCTAFSGDRSTGTKIDDEFIERVARKEIRTADERLRGNVRVVSYNGILLLTGQVEHDDLRSTAESAVASVKKVRLIHNEIAVAGKTGFLLRTNDRYLATKVKTKLIGTEDVDSARIKVVTEDGVVFLMGVIDRDTAERAVAAARTVSGVRKIVKVFEYQG